jgi:two-component system sensor histidine kinase FlrB
MNTTAQPSGEDIASDPQAEAQRLAEAFRIFNQASEELSTAYTALQSQVAELTAELAAANGALRQQYLEKVALTERLALLLDALPAGVILIGHDNVVVQTNPAAEAILAQALAGVVWPEFEQAHFVATEVPGEYRVGERQVAMNVTALDSSGVRIVLLHDVSETHVLKQQAERTQRLAAMGEMAAQLAHQLRTPLAAALLYTGNLELPTMADANRISIAGKAVGRLKHLERLIQDMLLFARGEVLGRERHSSAASSCPFRRRMLRWR